MAIPQYLTILTITAAVVFLLFTSASHSNIQQQNLSQQFISWKLKHNRQYERHVEMFRFETWKNNLHDIEEHNARADQGLESYHMGLNQFADLTDTQWTYLYLQNPNIVSDSSASAGYECTGPQPSDKDLPDAVDWAAKSATGAVRDQGTCAGAGYALAAAQSIQSGRYVSSGKMIELSAQQLIDCTDGYGNHGCMSGNVMATYDYIHKVGIASQKKYPYKGFHYMCSYSASQKEAELMNCVKVTPLKEVSIKAAVRRQPVAVSINAAKIKQYHKGVFDTSSSLINNCKTEHNHWMLLVGYGRDESEKKNYWKLKNSWGSGWGVQGYLYIVRKGDGEGECGVQTELYYPNAA